VWNAGPDEITAFHLHRPLGIPTIHEAWQLTPAGERYAVSCQGDMISLNRPLHQWEMVVVQ